MPPWRYARVIYTGAIYAHYMPSGIGMAQRRNIVIITDSLRPRGVLCPKVGATS